MQGRGAPWQQGSQVVTKVDISHPGARPANATARPSLELSMAMGNTLALTDYQGVSSQNGKARKTPMNR